MNGIKFKHQFQIAGEEIFLNFDGILGMDFLNMYKSNIDLESLKITSLLPPRHNLYESPEFENANKNIKAQYIYTYTPKTAAALTIQRILKRPHKWATESSEKLQKWRSELIEWKPIRLTSE